MTDRPHVPVLLEPVVQGLSIKPGGCYVDATFGRGGHSREILRHLGADGRLLAIDRDPQAVTSGQKQLGGDGRFTLVRGEFANLEEIVSEFGLQGRIAGVLLDLGVSSPQLDDAGRGFSFSNDGPLDMRMDPEQGTSAADWLARIDERSLRKVLFEFGEERQAVQIARAIVNTRASQPITRTGQLAQIVSGLIPRWKQKIHPATRTFQAIRIAVNQELEQLSNALEASLKILEVGGRLCVISFHSLEDRIVKRFMRRHAEVAEPYRGLPDIPREMQARLRLCGKPRTATAAEVEANPRARSARLRIAERQP